LRSCNCNFTSITNSWRCLAFKDYAGQWNTNNVTLCNNGNKINGVCGTASLSTQGQSVSLIYVDATKGWQEFKIQQLVLSGSAYITATGGTNNYLWRL
jgi:hypothetical protein